MERNIVLCKLIGSNDLERQEGQKVDWIGWITVSTNKVSLPPSRPACCLWRNCPRRSHTLKRMYSPCVGISILWVRGKHSSAQEGGYSGYTQWATLQFCLHDHGEDMMKGDGKSTLTLEACVCEWKGKPITKQCSSRKMASLVSSVQFPSRQEGLVLFLILIKRDFWFVFASRVFVFNEYCDQDLEGSCRQPGGAKGQPGLLDCVYLMAWHSSPTGMNTRL